jgi:hypothetical protein
MVVSLFIPKTKINIRALDISQTPFNKIHKEFPHFKKLPLSLLLVFRVLLAWPKIRQVFLKIQNGMSP